MDGNLSELDVDIFRGAQARGNRLNDDFARIREAARVYWSEASQCWMLTRHEDVLAMTMNRFPLKKGGREGRFFGAIPQAEWMTRIPHLATQAPLWITNTDDAKHTRLRRMLMTAFSRSIVEAGRENARRRVNELLNDLLPRGEFEFAEEFARPMAGYVLFKLIGLPESVFGDLKEWGIAITEAFGGTGVATAQKLERAEAAVVAMNAAVLVELEKRKVEPKNDLITTLLHASEAEGENGLTLDEIYAQMQLVIIAGHDTTANTMTLGVEALSRHPEVMQHIRDHPEDIDSVVAEIQRYVAMSAGQTRVATEDFELHGQTIRKGDLVAAVIMAADRDPLKVDRPDVLDITRDNREMMVFAPGPRSCIGHLLAKMQLAEFFQAFANRVDRVTVLDPELAWMPVFVFRGLYNLNIKVDASKTS